MLDSQQMNNIINPEDFQHNIQRLYQEMIKYELTHDFVSAQHYKIKAAKEQKRYQDWSISEMNNRHNQLKNILQKNYQEKLANCNTHHQSEINQYQIASHQSIKNMENTNKKQINDLRKRLEEELPSKVKESTQLINLRRMQEHMNKQKNFVEAYRVQTRIKQLYEQELGIWNEEKSKKIDLAIINLKNKHQKERDLFHKRMQIHLEDMNNKWHVQKNQLHQIYCNQLKQLKANQQREYLSFKRQFKTKGGLFWNKVQDSSDND